MENSDVPTDWGIKVLSLLSNQSYNDALNIAESCVNQRQAIGSHIIQGLFDVIENGESGKAIAENILRMIANCSPVDDVILELIDVSPKKLNSEYYSTLLNLYEILLGRECSKKPIFIDWCLQSARSFLNETEDYSSDRIKNYENYLNFLRNLQESNSPLSIEIEHELISYLLVLFTLEIPNVIAIDCSKIILRIVPDPYTLNDNFNYKDVAVNSVFPSEKIFAKALASFVHCVISTGHLLVYSLQYVYLKVSPFLELLLDDTSERMNLIGLDLLKLILTENMFTICHLNVQIGSVLEKLNNIMIYSDNKEIRTISLQCYEKMFESYDLKAKYYLLLNYRSLVTHSGTLALLISKIKKITELSQVLASANHIEYFKGKRLLDLLRLYCFLPNGDQTNIVENAEQILASLNFFWYLLSNKNRPELWSIIAELDRVYVIPLKTLITENLENCNKVLSEITSDGGQGDHPIRNIDIPEMSNDDKVKSVLCSRNAVELIQLTFERVQNCIDVKMSLSDSKPF